MVLPYKGIFYEMNSLVLGQGNNSEARRYPCADFELNAAECYEAYGLVKGEEMCSKFLMDLRECKSTYLAEMRYRIMRIERYKKIAKGEIPASDRWGKPYPYESFVVGSFAP